MIIGCGGTDGANKNRPAQAGASPTQTQQLTLTGCVQAGSGAGLVSAERQVELRHAAAAK
jgi:hypothetical protein